MDSLWSEYFNGVCNKNRLNSTSLKMGRFTQESNRLHKISFKRNCWRTESIKLLSFKKNWSGMDCNNAKNWFLVSVASFWNLFMMGYFGDVKGIRPCACCLKVLCLFCFLWLRIISVEIVCTSFLFTHIYCVSGFYFFYKIPTFGASQPPQIFIDPHWFSQKYIADPPLFYHKRFAGR